MAITVEVSRQAAELLGVLAAVEEITSTQLLHGQVLGEKLELVQQPEM
jgi:hypothetical protein